MYSVMIVDDEPIIRKGIASFIQWDTLNCQVTQEARNGLEAIELINDNPPDIIISDIKMPGMDGIGVSKYIYEQFPHIKVILLTGYSDFEYAQSAIRYNVVDFVLKPSSDEKITTAIKRAIEKIKEERLNAEQIQSMEERFSRNLTLLQEKFLYDYINGFSQHQLPLHKAKNDLAIHLNTYHVLLFKFTSSDSNALIGIKENKKNLLVEVKKFITSIFKEFDHYTITVDCNSICAIINIEDEDTQAAMAFLLNKSRELLNFFDNFMNISISLGLSNPHEGFAQLQSAYKEAAESLSLKFYEENNIFTYSDYEPSSPTYNSNLEDNFVERILNHIKLGHQEDAIDLMNTLIDQLKSSRKAIEHIKNIGILIASLSFKLFINHYKHLTETVEDSSKTYTDILNCDSSSELKRILEKVIMSSVDRLSYLSSQDNYIIKKVIRYIETNYGQQLKLDDLASLAHVNSSYLSRLIKQETGYTLTEIITKTRIEKAKELLSSSTLKTYEIAIEVGIEDPAYFSQVFKKYTGLSPSEFKKKR